MEFIRGHLDGIVCIKPDVHADVRGFFLESYNSEQFKNEGIPAMFVQDNHSLSVQKGVLRGLHFQNPPHAQSKLIRVTCGAIYDVVVDLRKDSPTYGKWKAFALSSRNFIMLFVPSGFAHGFCTLDENTEVQYKVDALYSPSCETGIRWDDPDIGIEWPVTDPILSAKDAALPYLKNLLSPF